MKNLICILGIIGCIMIVGFVEDPCSTEGIPADCMEQK